VTKLRRTRLLVAGLVVLVVALGAAGAVAATKAFSPSEESQAVITDAASQLGVTPAALSSALRKALEKRIDAAVAAGLLTKDQAAALKQRIESGSFPLVGPGLFGGHGPGFGFGHPGHLASLDAAAAYLGLSEVELRSQLASSKTLADVANAQGKSVSGLVDAMVSSAEKRIDQAVSDGKLTTEQAAAMKSSLRDRVTQLVNGDLAHSRWRPGMATPGTGSPRGWPPDMDGAHGFMPWLGPKAPSASTSGPNL
jgi:ribosomal protein S20